MTAPLRANRLLGPSDPWNSPGAGEMSDSNVRSDAATVPPTGVAGPDPQDGKAVGTVFVAVDGPGGAVVRELQLAGNRAVR